jgi:hypothetical protein
VKCSDVVKLFLHTTVIRIESCKTGLAALATLYVLHARGGGVSERLELAMTRRSASRTFSDVIAGYSLWLTNSVVDQLSDHGRLDDRSMPVLRQ